MELGWVYWKSQVVFAGVELGIFELLKGCAVGKNPAEIAAKLGLNPRATEMLLNALVSLELLTKKANCYQNSFLTSKYLVKGVPTYQGDRIHHLHNLWQRWEKLQQAIRTGQSVVEEKEPDPQRVRDFMTSMHNYARLKVKIVLSRLDVRPFRRLLDLGGGPGTYAIAVAQKNPLLTAVVYDLAQNLEIAREFIKEAGLEDRVSTQVGNFLEEDLPKEAFDAVLVSNVLHIYEPTTNISILKKCYDALQRGGYVIVHDFLINDTGTAPLYAVLFSLNMLLGTYRGACYTKAETQKWLSTTGFSRIKTRFLDKNSALIIGEKKT